MGLWRVLSDLEADGYRTEWGLFSAEETGAPHQRIRVFILAYRNIKGLEGFGRECSSKQTKGVQADIRSKGGTLHKLAHTASREPRQSQARNGGQDIGGGSEEELADSVGGRFEQCKSKCEKEDFVSQGGQHTRWPARPGEEQYEWEEPRVVADRKCERLEGQWNNKTEQHWENEGVQSRPKNGGDKHTGKAQSELGGAVDGSACGVDPIANRVDRLRLLGNGVVSQCSELAWKTLWRKMNEDNH